MTDVWVLLQLIEVNAIDGEYIVRVFSNKIAAQNYAQDMLPGMYPYKVSIVGVEWVKRGASTPFKERHDLQLWFDTLDGLQTFSPEFRVVRLAVEDA